MPPIYHITHLENLERIIRTHGLWCDAERLRQGFDCVGIAHQSLKARRMGKVVPVGEGGTLADYVPFYFANRSPMLYSIHGGNVVDYVGGQESIIYLVSSVETVAQGTRSWCFTDGHAVEAITAFFTSADELHNVDWDTIDAWSWKNTENDPDRKRRKQSEFLVRTSFPWRWIERIATNNADTRNLVAALIQNAEHQPEIVVERNWYY